MSKDPETCCIKLADGTRCAEKPLYKIGHRGFCGKHKPSRELTRKLTGTRSMVPEEDQNGVGPQRDWLNFCGF